MDWVKIHLAVNHVSVIGTPLLLLFLGWGCVRRVEPVIRAAVWWIAVFSVISIGLKFTGDLAFEQAVGKFQKTEPYVARHEQAADQATTGVFAMGLAAAVALFLGRKGRAFPAWSLAAIFLAGLATSVLLARTANLGGQISHPELRSPSGLPAQNPVQ